jgi:hypothetical protein
MSTHLLPAIRLLTVIGGLLITVDTGGRSAHGQVPDLRTTKDDDRVARLAEMKQIAGTFRAASIDGGAKTDVPQILEPLHRWSDPTRENSDGALWAWRTTGRPIAIMAIELYPRDRNFGTVWALEFTSLSTSPIRVEGGEHFNNVYSDLPPPLSGGRLRWAPAKGGLEFRQIDDAPDPASTPAERLRQMRDLLKRFSAREFYKVKSQEYALRPLPHPIDRYTDAASGTLDGAIFIYAHGTNPEVLLVIEAQRHGSGSPAWWYAAAPLTRAQPTVRLGQKDVWTHPFKEVPSTDDTYFLARKPRNVVEH